MCEKTSDSDRQQGKLAFLAEMTTNFQYIAGPLNTAADAMSHPPPTEEDADEVCAREWPETDTSGQALDETS